MRPTLGASHLGDWESPLGSDLRTLIERRSRRTWWAYLLWLACVGWFGYLVFWLAPCMPPDDPAPLIWIGAACVAIVVAQLIRPTLLGWFVLAAPTVAYVGVSVIGFLTGGPYFDESSLDSQILALMAVAVIAAVLAWPRSVRRASAPTSAST